MAKLKSLSRVELPREKLNKYGSAKLRDFELLAILLGSGIKGKNVLTLARSILNKILKIGLDRISLEDIKSIRGIGMAKATQILAMIELSRRLTVSKPDVLSPEDIWKLCSDIRDSKKEHFVAFYLDTQSRLIERQVISIGTINASLIHPREVFEPALSLRACSIVIAHNHPTGNLEPSGEDRAVTIQLQAAGKLLGINLDDHVIVTSRGFVSFRIKGWL